MPSRSGRRLPGHDARPRQLTYAEAVKFAAEHPDATQAEIEEKLASGEK